MRATLAAAFGRPPQLLSDRIPHPLGFAYAAGPRVPLGPPIPPDAAGDILEDDWPFVYLRARAIPGEYLRVLGLLILGSFLAVRGLAGGLRRDARDAFFFCFGAAFLLLETRGLTTLAVLIGSTWGVSSAVFAGVLTMALLATAVAARLGGHDERRVRAGFFVLLFAALAVNYAVPVAALAALPPLPRTLAGSALVALPMFASGVLFGRALDRSGEADRALSANLLGALVGGALEYLSMLVGFRALLLLAAAFYLAALAAALRTRDDA